METLNQLPADLMDLPGGVYRVGSNLRPRVVWYGQDYVPTPVEAVEIQKAGPFEQDNPVFFVMGTSPEGAFFVERSRFSHKAAMNGTTVPFKVAVNMDPLPVTSDGHFVLPVRMKSGKKTLTITGEMMIEDDFRMAAPPLRANLRRVYYKQQGVDICRDDLVRDTNPHPSFVVRDIPGKGLSFVVIVRLNVTKEWMERQYDLSVRPKKEQLSLSHFVYPKVHHKLPVEGTQEWVDLVGSEHADSTTTWPYLPGLLKEASIHLL